MQSIRYNKPNKPVGAGAGRLGCFIRDTYCSFPHRSRQDSR